MVASGWQIQHGAAHVMLMIKLLLMMTTMMMMMATTMLVMMMMDNTCKDASYSCLRLFQSACVLDWNM